MEDSSEFSEQQYYNALQDLELAINNFRIGRALGLLSLEDIEAASKIVEEKTKALTRIAALLDRSFQQHFQE